MELGHLHKDSPTTQERKARQRKNHHFFCLETHKKGILNEKILPIDNHNQGVFPQIRALPIFKKGQGRPPPLPPSSYASVLGPSYIKDVQKEKFYNIGVFESFAEFTRKFLF